MDYSTCIFDFDYTLGDATEGIARSINYALTKMGLPTVSQEEVKRTVGMSLPDTYIFLNKTAPPELKHLFSSLFMEKADKIMIQSTELFADTVEVLSHLKKIGFALGIVSTKRGYRLRQILNKFGIAHLFDVVVGSDDVKNPKPDPESLIQAIEMLGTQKEKVIYIGDSLVDAKTAHSANVDFIAVTTGATNKEQFFQFPHIAVVVSLSHLLDIIKTGITP
jgi:phosphoglycolate phosphatase